MDGEEDMMMDWTPATPPAPFNPYHERFMPGGWPLSPPNQTTQVFARPAESGFFIPAAKRVCAGLLSVSKLAPMTVVQAARVGGSVVQAYVAQPAYQIIRNYNRNLRVRQQTRHRRPRPDHSTSNRQIRSRGGSYSTQGSIAVERSRATSLAHIPAQPLPDRQVRFILPQPGAGQSPPQYSFDVFSNIPTLPLPKVAPLFTSKEDSPEPQHRAILSNWSPSHIAHMTGPLPDFSPATPPTPVDSPSKQLLEDLQATAVPFDIHEWSSANTNTLETTHEPTPQFRPQTSTNSDDQPLEQDQPRIYHHPLSTFVPHNLSPILEVATPPSPLRQISAAPHKSPLSETMAAPVAPRSTLSANIHKPFSLGISAADMSVFSSTPPPAAKTESSVTQSVVREMTSEISSVPTFTSTRSQEDASARINQRVRQIVGRVRRGKQPQHKNLFSKALHNMQRSGHIPTITVAEARDPQFSPGIVEPQKTDNLLTPPTIRNRPQLSPSSLLSNTTSTAEQSSSVLNAVATPLPVSPCMLRIQSPAMDTSYSDISSRCDISPSSIKIPASMMAQYIKEHSGTETPKQVHVLGTSPQSDISSTYNSVYEQSTITEPQTPSQKTSNVNNEAVNQQPTNTDLSTPNEKTSGANGEAVRGQSTTTDVVTQTDKTSNINNEATTDAKTEELQLRTAELTIGEPKTPQQNNTPKADHHSTERRTRTTRAQIKKEEAEKEKLQFEIVPLNKYWTNKVLEAVQRGHGDYQPTDFARVVPSGMGGGTASWLNDETINGYLELVAQQGRKNDRVGQVPSQHAFKSFFYKNLTERGYDSVRRWATRAKIGGKNLLKCEQIYIPINAGMHWTLAVVSGTSKTIRYYNSMNGHGRHHLSTIKSWLRSELGKEFDEAEWVVEDNASSPQQQNMNDCGVFTITSARQIMLGLDPMTYTPGQIPTQRKRIVAELVNGGLLKGAGEADEKEKTK